METQGKYNIVSIEDFDKLTKVSKSFCPLVYYHTTINTVGDQKLCCIAKAEKSNDITKVTKSENSIEQWWNSDYLQKSRKLLNNNQYPTACLECKENDDMGIASFRSQNIEKVRTNEDLRSYIYSEANYATENNFKVNNQSPINFDIKFGNLCNLKCRMCDYVSSSQILKEIINNPELKEYHPTVDEVNEETFDLRYFEKENFVESFNNVINDTVFLKFTGGEPLLIDNMFKFLKKLIKGNLSKDIELHFITNATKITKQMIEDYFLHFKNVFLTISLDGYKSNYEYVRYPAKWEVMKNNLDLVKKYSNKLVLDYSITFQTYSCISMIKQYEFMSQYAIEDDLQKNGVSPTYVKHPYYLDLKLLPNVVKEKLIDMYQKSDIIKNLPAGYKKDWNNKIKYLSYQNKKDDDLVAIKEFVRYTKTLDKVRTQSFKNSCPEEWDLLKEYFDGS